MAQFRQLMVDSYLTLGAQHTIETEIRRSRFLTYLSPARTEDEAREFIAKIRALHPQATHNCTAFVVGPRADLRRSSDDGEPSGTAGIPMLEALVAGQVSDVVAVVTRYYGGIQLGAGGLVRAYRGAVTDGLASAPLVRRQLVTVQRATVDYALAPVLISHAHRHNWRVDAQYGAEVELTWAVAPDQLAPLTTHLVEASNGTAELSAAGEQWVDLPR